MTDEDADPVGTDPGGPPDEDVAERLVARVARHDEELARDVRRIIDQDAELHTAADELEDVVADREERIEELDTEGEASDEDEGGASDADRVEELEAAVEEREERIAELRARLDDREDEVEDLTGRLKRKQADFQNYKKRQERKLEGIKERATEDLVERLLDVRDNLRRALEDDHDDVESLREGVEMTLREFDRVLEDENVTEVAPDPGEEIDPQHHEVMMRVDADEPEGTVADLYAPGYRMADRVLRPAQVAVSKGSAGGDGTAEGAGGADAGGEGDADGGTATAAADADDDQE